VENPPFGRLIEVILSATYKVHPYKIPPIGIMADLNAASIEDVREFHRVYYVPNNATIIISGDFDTKPAIQWVERHFGSIPKGKPVPRETPAEPPQTSERRVVEYDTKAPLPAVILTYHVPEDGHPDMYALRIAGNILSAGQSSRLYRSLVYEQQIAVAAAGQTLALEDPGVLGFFAIMNQGQTADAGEKVLMAEIEKIKREPVSDEELDKAKNQFVSQLVFGRESVQEKADDIGYAAVILDDVTLVNKQLAAYQKVTTADVQRVAQKYFTDQNRTVVYMLPEATRPQDKSAIRNPQSAMGEREGI
jgi:zinc protease